LLSNCAFNLHSRRYGTGTVEAPGAALAPALEPAPLYAAVMMHSSPAAFEPPLVNLEPLLSNAWVIPPQPH
jgi:hypothetical protein